MQKPNGPIMAVIISTSTGLPVKKNQLGPQKPFARLRFSRMFKTGQILVLAKGLRQEFTYPVGGQ